VLTSPPGAPTPGAAGGRRVAWFHCFAGIAGDMALGSLLDAGADLQEVVSLLERLPFTGWKLETAATMRSGIGATAVTVLSEESAIIRTASHIVGLIEEARLPHRVRDRSLAVFAALADAEGRIHRRPPASVHFHEVGGVDAIVDVVGTCAALEVLEVDHVCASAVATGTGMTRSAHGVLPNPGPAVLELLRGAPTYGRDISVELTTPTGAALLAGLVSVWGPMPGLSIEATGYGAGTRELDDLPNLTQVVLGTMADEGPAADAGQPVVLLEANLDDATGETIAHAIAQLLTAGAHDAWVTPVLMKKGRPGYTVSALSDPALAGQVAGTLASETGSTGVRGTTFERWPAARSNDEVDVAGYPVRVKVSPGRVKAEHADAARVARLTGLPLREVSFRAEETWRRRPRPGPNRDGDEPA
ncbi:MAG: nickel pincer cofactor biosynthesis protein LarC, partial [Actinobacteria bacterium]|nr:nickel pincer cofactor biosynthesis protein LarC [Actinomycetota bacterium]